MSEDLFGVRLRLWNCAFRGMDGWSVWIGWIILMSWEEGGGTKEGSS